MDNELLNKCIAQGNNLAKVCTVLHERLLKAEAQNAKLVQISTALVQRVTKLEAAVTAMPEKIDAITDMVNHISDVASKPKASSRTPRNYADYERIMNGLREGKSLKGMSKEFGIPYSTVSAYAHMTDEEVAKLVPADNSQSDAEVVSNDTECEPLPQEQLAQEAFTKNDLN